MRVAGSSLRRRPWPSWSGSRRAPPAGATSPAGRAARRTPDGGSRRPRPALGRRAGVRRLRRGGLRRRRRPGRRRRSTPRRSRASATSRPTVDLADVSEPGGRPGHDGHRDVRLDLADRPRRLELLRAGELYRGRRRVAGRLGRRHHRALAAARRSPSTWSAWAPSAATSWAPVAWRWSPTGRWCASASTAPRSARPRPVASAREVARLVDIDAAAYAKRVEASGRWPSSRRSSTARTRCRAGVLRRYARHQGRRGASPASCRWRRRKGFAAPILGSVGEVTAEMIEEHPDLYQVGDVAGLSGLQARYDEQLRGTPGQEVNAVGSDGKTREIFRVDAERRAAPRADDGHASSRSRPSRRSAGVGPAARAGRDQAVDRGDPGGGERAGHRRPTTSRRTGSPRRARRSSRSRSPGAAAGRRHPGHGGAVHHVGRGRRQAVRELRRLPGVRRWATSRCARRSRTPATPPSSPSAASSDSSRSSTPPRRSAWGSTTTSASRRTSATSCRPPARPRRPPT